jgi:hypothetical protein
MFCPGDVVEVRVPKAGRHKTISGYFDDFEVLTAEVERLDGLLFPGVYWDVESRREGPARACQQQTRIAR